jgi:hypothetical protein
MHKLISFLICVSFIGCLKKDNDWLVLKQYYDKNVNRLPSSEGKKSECLDDNYNLTGLKAEIKELEEQRTEKVDGMWKHLDFSKMPAGQAHYLKGLEEIGDLNRPDDIDYSNCFDVPCIINQVYNYAEGVEIKDRLEGYAIYLWYLRMGNYLNIDNKVYQQKSKKPGEIEFKNNQTQEIGFKSYPLKDYLFTKNEVYAFWRLSHGLPIVLRQLPYLVNIERYPKGSYLESHGTMTCGLAGGDNIRLNDNCLSLDSNDKSGFFYEAVTHELAHHLDTNWGRKNGGGYFSEKEFWMQEVGGWIKEEIEENKILVTTWKPGINENQFPSNYAMNSPVEHFAETTSLYRFEPVNTKSRIPLSTYDWTKNRIFEKWEFTPEGLIQAGVNHSILLDWPIMLSDLDQCVSKVGEHKERCIDQKKQSIENKLSSFFKEQIPEGCSNFKRQDFMLSWNKYLNEDLPSFLQKRIDSSIDLKTESNQLGEVMKKYFNAEIYQKLYLNCLSQDLENICYDQQLEGFLSSIEEKENFLNKDDLIWLKQQIRDFFIASVVKEQTIEVYQNFVLRAKSQIEKQANQLFTICIPAQYDDSISPVIKGSFSVKDGFMTGIQFNCLNEKYDLTIDKFIESIEIDGRKLEADNEIDYLKSIIDPIFNTNLFSAYNFARMAESNKYSTIIKDLIPEIVFSVRMNLRKLNLQDNKEEFSSQCSNAINKKFGLELFYHQIQDLSKKEVQKSCEEIWNSIDFKTPYVEYQESDYIQMEKMVLLKIEELGKNQAKKCIEKYPLTTLLLRAKHKEERESCLIKPWRALEQQAIDESLSDKTIIDIDQSRLFKILKMRERVIQQRIILKEFRG